MILLIEGPDGSGKTTLARHLAKRYSLYYHHEGPPPRNMDPLVYYTLKLTELRSEHGNLVIDRFALGERVYGPIYRGEDRLGEEGWKNFIEFTKPFNVFQFICAPPYEVALANWKKNHANEMFTDQRIYGMTFLRFMQLARETGQPIYDYTNPSHDRDLHARIHTFYKLS